MAAAAVLAKLPAELIDQIVGNIPRKTDLINMLCTATFLRPHVLPQLYDSISITSFPGKLDQAASDFKCLQRLYIFTSLLMRPEQQHRATLVRSFNFETYMGSDHTNEHQAFLPRNQMDLLLLQAIQHGTVFPTDSPGYLEKGYRYFLEDPCCADYMLALLLPFLSSLVHLRLIFYRNSKYCDRMLHMITRLPGRIFPRTAFQNLKTITGDSGQFLTHKPLWENYNTFFHIPSVTTIIGHQQRFCPHAQLLDVAEPFVTVTPGSSQVNTIMLTGTKRQARELIMLVEACASLSLLALGYGNPGQFVSPWELLDLTDLPKAAQRSTLESLCLAYRESVEPTEYFFSHDVTFAYPFTDFRALKVLKLGMMFIFDYQCFFFDGEQSPIEIARAVSELGQRLAGLLPPQLEHLVIRRHVDERHMPLLCNVEHVLSQKERFHELRSVVVENMFVGGCLSLACHELREPSIFSNASMELGRRAREIGVLFINVDNCPK